MKVYKKISLLDENIWKKRKLVEVKKIIESCIGLTIQVNSPTPFITKNNELDLNIKVIHQTSKNIILKSIGYGEKIIDRKITNCMEIIIPGFQSKVWKSRKSMENVRRPN